MSILENKKNIYSQNGEDGIIEYIFNKLDIKNGKFIEFGAWDGKHLSNTYNLFNKGWNGIYIESDLDKYKTLKNNFINDIDQICCLNKMVGYKKNDNLDSIIEKTKFSNSEFDFISIDVDGLDYYIFKAMDKYLPKVISIEVNAGHSPLYDKEIDIDIAKNNIGQSITIICKEAVKKGYFPLCYTGNLFLIKEKFRSVFITDIKNIKDIYIDFLKYLNNSNPGGVEYLYNLFVIKKEYNNMLFENEILKNYFNNLHNPLNNISFSLN